MEIVIRSGLTLCNKVVDMENEPYKKRIENKMSGKRKKLDKSNNKVLIQNKPNIENPEEVEEKIESEEGHKHLMEISQN